MLYGIIKYDKMTREREKTIDKLKTSSANRLNTFYVYYEVNNSNNSNSNKTVANAGYWLIIYIIVTHLLLYWINKLLFTQIRKYTENVFFFLSPGFFINYYHALLNLSPSWFFQSLFKATKILFLDLVYCSRLFINIILYFLRNFIF